MSYNDKICNSCGKKFTPDLLYVIREKPTVGKYCAKCYVEVPKRTTIVVPKNPITFAQYQGLTNTQSTTRSTNGFANINGSDYEVTLEEITTTTRRIILNPKTPD